MRVKKIWFKPDKVCQIKHLGNTGFYWVNSLKGNSLGLGLPANEVEIIAQWNIKYKTFWQVLVYKIRRLFA